MSDQPAPFTPCSKHCPTVTGKPYGTLQYCPRAENERHKQRMAEQPDGVGVYRNNRDGTHTTTDGCTGERVIVRATDDGWDPEVPLHPDDTDCCRDFGCCPDAFRGLLGSVFAQLAGAGEEGAVIPVKPPASRGDA